MDVVFNKGLSGVIALTVNFFQVFHLLDLKIYFQIQVGCKVL